MGGPQGGFDPASQPGTFDAGIFASGEHHRHHHIEDPLDPIFPAGVRRRGIRRYPRRTSGPALVVLWIVRLAILAFFVFVFVFVAVAIFHVFAST
jgi:hypothetical protein